jgi:hypothetical protein
MISLRFVGRGEKRHCDEIPPSAMTETVELRVGTSAMFGTPAA